MNVNGVQIKDGQTWHNGRGDLIRIRSNPSSDTFPWAGTYPSGGEDFFTASGQFTGSRPSTLRDLVELVQDTPSSLPEAFLERDLGEADADFASKAINAFVHSKPLAEPCPVDQLRDAAMDPDHPYHLLSKVLVDAFAQAAVGKGKERHASGGTPFHQQPMVTINRQLGSVDGFIYQAHKKSLEAKRLPEGRAQAELLGSINYLAGAVIALDTWAKKVAA